jgi:hypothetical protein
LQVIQTECLAHRDLQRSDQQFIGLVEEYKEEEHDHNEGWVEIALPFHINDLISK